VTPLYGGSARYYQQGRLPYPRTLAEQLVRAVPSAAGGRLLDVGCGPGRLTLLLADHFTEVVGVDADPDMIERANAATAVRGDAALGAGIRFLQMSAEELPGDLGRFDVVTFALSFHWLDQDSVARAAFQLLRPGGFCVHVHAWSLRGEPVEGGNPLPPYAAVAELLDGYLGPNRWLANATPGEESVAMRAAGFEDPTVVPVPGGEVVTSTVDDLVARSYSTSGATPDRLGARRDDAERDLRRLLREASPSGHFDERLRAARLAVWRRP
jgi:SAM-dependent methyltransferase